MAPPSAVDLGPHLERARDFVQGLRSLVHVSRDGEHVSPDGLLIYITAMFFLGAVVSIIVKVAGRGALTAYVKTWGVRVQRLARTVREIERKMFHAAGLLVPVVYNLLLGRGFSEGDCALICWAITATGWAMDLSRLHIPFVRRNWPLSGILREKEQTQLTGGCFFSLGCTLAINLFSAPTATASICFLVVGDMCAALFGVAFGGDACVVKLGRQGKKSLEGSVAMFCACFAVGMCIFREEPLREYAVFFGALVATLVELWEPFALNDNLTIPLISGLALHAGFARLSALCDWRGGT